MPRKKHSPDEIILKPRESEVMMNDGQTVAAVCRKPGITEQTFCRWRNHFGGLKASDAKLMKEMQLENTRPKRAIADLTLEDQICLVGFILNCKVVKYIFCLSK